MKGGSISGNSAYSNAGGVYVSGGTFNIHVPTGSSLTVYAQSTGEGLGKLTINDVDSGNAGINGGGVFVMKGTFTMTGGSITNNTAAINGGGVYVDSGTFNVSGAPSISGNTKGNADYNNVYLERGKTITVTGTLTTGAKIGVKMEAPGVFTTGYASGGTGDSAYTNPASPELYFTSDDTRDPRYDVRPVNGEAALGVPYRVTVAEGIQNGILEADKATAIAGETVTLTLAPETDYVLSGLSVKRGEADVPVTDNTFTMPAGDVVVSATFEVMAPAVSITWAKNDTPEGGYKAGDTISYTVTATNTGNVRIPGFTVSTAPAENSDEAAFTCGESNARTFENLDVGEANAQSFTASHVVTNDDIIAGKIVLRVQCAAATVGTAVPVTYTTQDNQTGTAPSTTVTTHDLIDVPTGYTITAREIRDDDHTVTGNETPYGLGNKIRYTITIENTGIVKLQELFMEMPGCEEPAYDVIMDVDDRTRPKPITHTVTEQDLMNGSVTLNVIAVAKDYPNPKPGGAPITPKATIVYQPNATTTNLVEPKAEYSVTVDECYENGDLLDSPMTYGVGDTVHYKVTVTNTGNLTLPRVDVSDETFDPDLTFEKVVPGQSQWQVVSHEVTAGDITKGGVTIAPESQAMPIDNPVDSTKPYVPKQEPATVSKTNTNFEDIDPKYEVRTALISQPADVNIGWQAGEVVSWQVTVRNTGNVDLTNVKVDNEGFEPASTTVPSLPYDREITWTVSRAITEEDLVNGSVKIQSVTGADPVKDHPAIPEMVYDPTEVKTEVATAGLEGAATLTGSPAGGVYHPGDAIGYTMTVANTGSMTAKNVVATADGFVAAPASVDSLAPGETAAIALTHTVTAADIINGVSFRWTATGDSIDNPKYANAPFTFTVSGAENDIINIAKADQKAPKAPTVTDATAASVTVKANAGEAYVIVPKGADPTNIDWRAAQSGTDSVTFTADNGGQSLAPAGAYEVYARRTETDALNASPASRLAAVTLPRAQAVKSAVAPSPDQVTAGVNSIKLEQTAHGQQYVVLPGGAAPTEADWVNAKPGDGGALSFTGLMSDTGYTVFTRVPGDAMHAPSEAVFVDVKTTKPAEGMQSPSVQGTTGDTVTITTRYGEQYSIDGGQTWITPAEGAQTHTFNGLQPGTDYEILAKKGDAVSDPAAIATLKQAQNAPGAPAVESRGADSIAVTGAEAAQEYSIDGGSTWVKPDSGGNEVVFGGLKPGMAYEVVARMAATDTRAASDPSEPAKAATDKAAQNAPAAAPVILKTEPTAITVDGEDGMEYSIDGGQTWVKPGADGNAVFGGLTPNTAYTIIGRNAATDTQTASQSGPAAAATTLKAEQAAPAKPTAQIDGGTVISSVTEPGQQYIVLPAGETPTEADWKNAQDGNGHTLTFDGLTPGGDYAVYTRFPCDEQQNPSPAPR